MPLRLPFILVVATTICLLPIATQSIALRPDSSALVPKTRFGRTGQAVRQELLESELHRITDSVSVVMAKHGWKPMTFDAHSVEYRIEESVAVPGLSYTTAIVAPPGTDHTFFFAIAVSRNDSVLIARNVQDWGAVALQRAWKPGSMREAVQLCEEAVHFGLAASRRSRTAITFTDSSQLHSLILVNADSVRAMVSPPTARQEKDGTWSVELWSLLRDKTDRYHCELGAGRLWLVTLDSRDGSGLAGYFYP